MARHFNGGTDEAHWSQDGFLTGGPGCLAFWMRTTQVTANVIPLSWWTSSSRHGIGLLLNNTAGKLTTVCYQFSEGVPQLVSTTTLNDGNAHHIAFNYNRANGASNQLYVDGVQEAAGNSTFDWSASFGGIWVQCGKNADGFWGAYVGDIWEVANWIGSQLSADEIAALAKGFSPKLIKREVLNLYAPLVRDTRDIQNSPSAAAATGGSVVDHRREFGGSI